MELCTIQFLNVIKDTFVPLSHMTFTLLQTYPPALTFKSCNRQISYLIFNNPMWFWATNRVVLSCIFFSSPCCIYCLQWPPFWSTFHYKVKGDVSLYIHYLRTLSVCNNFYSYGLNLNIILSILCNHILHPILLKMSPPLYVMQDRISCLLVEWYQQ